MSDAAQGELQNHEVFKTPLKVEPKYEEWTTPENYHRYAIGEQLPATVRVWRIQNVAKDGEPSNSVVAHHYGFADSPDAEILTAGFNEGKESGAMGVGRHGNFLQWGFSASPAKMTDAGKAFFINCICYIRKFDGKRPLITRRNSGREYSLVLAGLIGRIKDEQFLKGIATPELLAKYKDNPQGLVDYYRQNIELIYSNQGCQVDSELAALGLKSNRQIATLEKLVAMLRDPQHQAEARKLLARYTEQTFTTPEQWETWLKQSQGRIYFSDTAGYKFLVVPVGYLDQKK
jgi:hypothetical protein